jgi:hypothetical protein
MVVALMPHLGLQKEPFHAWNARRLSLDPSGPGEAQEKQVFSIKQRKKDAHEYHKRTQQCPVRK